MNTLKLLINITLLFGVSQAFAGNRNVCRQQYQICKEDTDKKVCKEQFRACKDERKTCREQFRTEVKECTQNSVPGLELKACLTEARNDKKMCLEGEGTNQCIATCDDNKVAADNQCNIDYDISVCGGEPKCESSINNQKLTCLDSAQLEYSQCSSNCGVDL